MSEKAVFKVDERLVIVLSGFRVTQKQHEALKTLAAENNLKLGDIIRQMIDFAIKHMERK